MAIFEKSQDRLPGNVETIIGPTVKVEGNFVGEGDVAVEDFLKKGYLSEALLNFVLLLGWNSGGDKEIFDLDAFTATSMPRS